MGWASPVTHTGTTWPRKDPGQTRPGSGEKSGRARARPDPKNKSNGYNSCRAAFITVGWGYLQFFFQIPPTSISTAIIAVGGVFEIFFANTPNGYMLFLFFANKIAKKFTPLLLYIYLNFPASFHHNKNYSSPSSSRSTRSLFSL